MRLRARALPLLVAVLNHRTAVSGHPPALSLAPHKTITTAPSRAVVALTATAAVLWAASLMPIAFRDYARTEGLIAAEGSS